MAEEPKGPVVDLELRWERDLVFHGRAGALEITIDGNTREAVSPVQTLAFALASCMASDVVLILTRGRHPLQGLTAHYLVHLHAQRAATDPRRILGVDLRFDIVGPVPPEAVQRAIDLSRDKYCSVWHSLRQDIDFTVSRL